MTYISLKRQIYVQYKDIINFLRVYIYIHAAMHADFVPEIAPAELHGVNVPCRIYVYSKKKDFKAKICHYQCLSSSVDQKQEGIYLSNLLYMNIS